MIDHNNYIHAGRDKDWGHYEDIDRTYEETHKILYVEPGKETSKQYHRKRSEAWYIAKGYPTLLIGDRTYQAQPGDTFTVPVTAVHRISNRTPSQVVIYEVQRGECSEADIVRLE